MNDKKLQESLLKSIPKSSPAIRKAIIDIVARKYTWRLASIVNGVTESGIPWRHAARRAEAKRKASKSTLLTALSTCERMRETGLE